MSTRMIVIAGLPRAAGAVWLGGSTRAGSMELAEERGSGEAGVVRRLGAEARRGGASSVAGVVRMLGADARAGVSCVGGGVLRGREGSGVGGMRSCGDEATPASVDAGGSDGRLAGSTP